MCYTVVRALFLSLFLFQAEGGIRDLVRSRGLGDVYKRQVDRNISPRWLSGDWAAGAFCWMDAVSSVGDAAVSVSYTHLTLPTSDLV